MAVEIERKFLVKNDSWRHLAKSKAYRQGYLCVDKDRTVRVRIAGDTAYLTIKGISVGASRLEYEYEIPVIDADMMLNQLCVRPFIEKKRYEILSDGLIWEVDEFEGTNKGLIIAEVELETEDQNFCKPDWIGEQVTGDPRYYNVNLIANPFTTW